MIPAGRILNSSEFSTQPLNQFGLAIEVVSRQGSVAMILGGQVFSESRLPAQKSATASLIPAISEMLSGFSDRTPDYIAVANGPGSFTGLRIAVSTAKTLAYAFQRPLIAIDSLAAIAAATFVTHSCEGLLVALNAYRGQVYRGWYSRDAFSSGAVDGGGQGVDVLEAQEWTDEIARTEWPCHVTGDRNAFLFDRNASGESSLVWVDASVTRSAGVAILADRRFREGRVGDCYDVLPRYLRKSTAEETADKGTGM